MCFASTLFAQNNAIKSSEKNISLTNAYDYVAPYVNKETFLVVRIDATSLDAEKFCTTYNEIFNGFMKERGFDRNAINATNREFKKCLEIMKARISKMLAMRDNFGIQEMFIVMQKQSPLSFRIVIPLSPSTKKDVIQKVSSFTIGFDVTEIPNGVCLIFNKEFDQDIYKSFKPEVNATLKDFYATNSDDTIQIYCNGLKIRKLFETTAPKPKEIVKNLPKETLKGLESFDVSFQYALISYNGNLLTFKSQYFFTTAERAEDFRTGLEYLINYLVDSHMDHQDMLREDPFNLKGIYKEFTRGVLISLIPKRNTSVLYFESTIKSSTALSHPCMTSLFYLMLSQMNPKKTFNLLLPSIDPTDLTK